MDGVSSDLTTVDPSASVLTVERLVDTRWSFGDSGQLPWSRDFHFNQDGSISGQASPNHKYWQLQAGQLRIYDEKDQLAFSFETISEPGSLLCLRGIKMINPQQGKQVELAEIAPTRSANAASSRPHAVDEKAEPVRLVIWDLDETFWTGTLSEGGITTVEAHMNVVRVLNARGIVNSICSKNEFAQTETELRKHGIWDQFVFPRIAFAAKGEMIKQIIEAAQLRTPSVLFIDDNPMNINEALHYNPGIQVCAPSAIAGLLDDPRCKGKPDPSLTRLARYRVLEKKFLDQVAKGSDNREFLRQSEIRISFHYDIMAEFPRIHDLVNRTNQLNFTKRRWPEDIEEAKAVYLEEFAKDFETHCGYVKVSDRYGSYGIVGFYLRRKLGCVHFLFSCRTLNMGVEQFVWQRLRRPRINIVGEVVSELGDDPDWLSVVDDADSDSAGAGASRTSICLRGACDLSMMSHYLRTRFNTIEETSYPYQGWIIHPLARAVALADELDTEAGKAFIAKMPGLPPDVFSTALNTRAADVYVLSFSQERFAHLYQSRSTGLTIPLSNSTVGNIEFRETPFESVAEKVAGSITREEWDFLQSDLSRGRHVDKDLLASDVKKLFEKLQGKLVIVLRLNTVVGSNKWLLQMFDQTNRIVLPIAAAAGCHIINLADYVKSPDDLVRADNGGDHYRRDIYQNLAARVAEIIASTEAANAPGSERMFANTDAPAHTGAGIVSREGALV